MKTIKLLSTMLVALLALNYSVSAQLPMGQQAGLQTALKLFGDITAFSARTDIRMLDKAEKETLSMAMNFAMLDGKVRAEMDVSQFKSQELSAEMLGSLKQMGMDKMVTIMRPDKKVTLVVYPTLQAYAEVAVPAEESYKVEKVKLGKETIDGHPCEKHKITVTSSKGEKHQAQVWNAIDLKNFPIKMQVDQPEATIVMHHKNVNLAKPDAKQFDAPTGFTKHDSIEKLMQGAMMKMLGGSK